jgi:hypothetical protein
MQENQQYPYIPKYGIPMAQQQDTNSTPLYPSHPQPIQNQPLSCNFRILVKKFKNYFLMF